MSGATPGQHLRCRSAGATAVPPARKPIALIAEALRDCSRRGDIVLDTFCGSGSTILAAGRVDRKVSGLEPEPRYLMFRCHDVCRGQTTVHCQYLYASTFGDDYTGFTVSYPSDVRQQLRQADELEYRLDVHQGVSTLSRTMKSAPFEYSRPATLEEACALLAGEEGARIIAGGQTLVPMMAMRLARPSRLVDIGRLSELSYLRDEGRFVEIGAATRQCIVESDTLIAMKVPLLAAAMPYVGHAAIRARGTVGGSLANADPAAEIALVAVTLEAKLCYREGTRDVEIPAADFFLGAMTTALPPSGCLTAVRFPVWAAERLGVGFHEVNARRGDFAFVSAAAQVSLDPDGTCQKLALGIGAATEFPIRLHSAEQALLGTRLEESVVRTALVDAVAEIGTLADLHASADYRRRVAGPLVCRAISDAVRAAQAQRAHAH